MADGNITKDVMYEAVAPDDFEAMLELDRSPHPIRDALTPPVALEHGTVAIPEAPGLGVAPDRAALAHWRV